MNTMNGLEEMGKYFRISKPLSLKMSSYDGTLIYENYDWLEYFLNTDKDHLVVRAIDHYHRWTENNIGEYFCIPNSLRYLLAHRSVVSTYYEWIEHFINIGKAHLLIEVLDEYYEWLEKSK